MEQNFNQNIDNRNELLNQPKFQNNFQDSSNANDVLANNNTSNNTINPNTTTNPNATVIPVEVPVAVPVQVPVEIQVPVAVPVPVEVYYPVYVPVTVQVKDNITLEQELKEQNKQQQQQQFQHQQFQQFQQFPQQNPQIQESNLPQTSEYSPLFSTSTSTNNNMNEISPKVQESTQFQESTPQVEESTLPQRLENTSNVKNENENEKETEDLLKVDFNEIKNNINSGLRQASITLSNIVESGKEQLSNLTKDEKKEEIKLEKPQSQSLDEEDIKKDYKDVSTNVNNNSSLNNLMNQAKDTLNSGVEIVKNNLGLNTQHIKKTNESKEPLMGQALEEPDKKIVENIDSSNITATSPSNFEINELHDVKKEHKTNTNINSTETSSNLNNMINQTKDFANESVETLMNKLKLDSNKQQSLMKEPELEQPLMQQPLEQQDTKMVDNFENRNITTATTPSNFEINELHDIKKEHKRNENIESSKTTNLNDMINQTKEVVNDSVETLKSRLGFDFNNKDDEKSLNKEQEQEQPLMKQPLEEQDRISTQYGNEKLFNEQPVLQSNADNTIGSNENFVKSTQIDTDLSQTTLQNKKDREEKVRNTEPLNSF